MPWARIPPDKLINLPLFGIDVIVDEGDFLWLRGPSGRMRVSKKAPRVWFEEWSDAHQAGATAIKISTVADEEALEAFQAAEAESAASSDE